VWRQRERNDETVDLERMVNRWSLDYYLFSALQAFRDGRYDDFSQIRDIIQNLLVRPFEFSDIGKKKIRVMQFLSRINEGDRLDCIFDSQESCTPLESALSVLESISQEVEVPQQELERVHKSICEMVRSGPGLLRLLKSAFTQLAAEQGLLTTFTELQEALEQELQGESGKCAGNTSPRTPALRAQPPGGAGSPREASQAEMPVQGQQRPYTVSRLVMEPDSQPSELESSASQEETSGGREEHVADQEEHVADQEEHVADQEEHVADQEEHVANQEEHVADQEELAASPQRSPLTRHRTSRRDTYNR
uniref:Telomeric repeat binding factor 2 n=1 Tax=Paramormyrops kingsleyae TaxID=1676925 RepID=A0A3B3RWR8_9TELE